jgi:hypothetical protein
MARPERFERPTLWFVGKKLKYFLLFNSHLKRLPIPFPAHPSHNHVTATWANAQNHSISRSFRIAAEVRVLGS